MRSVFTEFSFKFQPFFDKLDQGFPKQLIFTKQDSSVGIGIGFLRIRAHRRLELTEVQDVCYRCQEFITRSVRLLY